MRRQFTTLITLAVIALASGCSDSATDPNAPFGGAYLLKTVNGTPLPRTITISGGTVRLNSMRLSIQQDGSYKQTADYTPLTYTGDVQTEALGTWMHDEATGSVVLRDQAGYPWAVGSSKRNTLTVTTALGTAAAETWVYQR